MGGLLIASIGSGQLITRSGRYKVFPIVGTAVTRGRALPALADGRGHERRDRLAVHVRARPRSRPRDAGARARGPERRPLQRARRRDLGRDPVPLDRGLLRRVRARGDLREPAGPQPHEGVPGTGGAPAAAARPLRARAASAGRPRRLRAGVHRLAQRRLPRRGGDRRRGVRASPGSSRSCRSATPSRPRASARRSRFRRTPIRSPSSPASSASSPAASRQTASSNASPHGPGSTWNRPRSGCSDASTATPTWTSARWPTPTQSNRSGSTTHSARSSTPV